MVDPTESVPPGALYQSHKRVRAFCIAEINKHDNNHADPLGATLVPDDEAFPPLDVSGEYIAKHQPQVGGYWVLYADGYQSFSPASAFEQGYTLIAE
jgi:hypothetical protein